MRKPYEKPAATKLTLEQAKLKLLGYTIARDPAAMQLLELMFPEPRVTDEKPKRNQLELDVALNRIRPPQY